MSQSVSQSAQWRSRRLVNWAVLYNRGHGERKQGFIPQPLLQATLSFPSDSPGSTTLTHWMFSKIRFVKQNWPEIVVFTFKKQT